VLEQRNLAERIIPGDQETVVVQDAGGTHSRIELREKEVPGEMTKWKHWLEENDFAKGRQGEDAKQLPLQTRTTDERPGGACEPTRLPVELVPGEVRQCPNVHGSVPLAELISAPASWIHDKQRAINGRNEGPGIVNADFQKCRGGEVILTRSMPKFNSVGAHQRRFGERSE
jgi:hypothetical protein